MSVSDLTNTTWNINHTFTTPNMLLFYLEGTITATQWASDNNLSTTFYPDANQGIFNFVVGGYYDDLESDWFYQSGCLDIRVTNNTDEHRNWYSNQSNYNNLVITITGGDVTSSSLISWLQDNATQVTPDLTNTTWLFNDTIPEFSINTNFSINFTSNNYTFTQLSLYDYDDDGHMRWGFQYNGGDVYPSYDSDLGWYGNTEYKEITITGGTDVNNSTLIQFLQANATLQESGGGDTTTSTGKIGDLPIIKKHFGNLEIIKEVLNGVTIYEIGTTPNNALLDSDGKYLLDSDGKYLIQQTAS